MEPSAFQHTRGVLGPLAKFEASWIGVECSDEELRDFETVSLSSKLLTLKREL